MACMMQPTHISTPESLIKAIKWMDGFGKTGTKE